MFISISVFYVNDLEQEMISKDIAGLDLDYFKLFLLMYADDIVLFSETDEGARTLSQRGFRF